MDAVILAGGKGSRLRPITDYTPKSLVPISDIPIIEWQMRYLAKYGIRRVIICSGYLEDQIKNYVESRGYDNVVFSTESSPLGTGGALRKASALVRGASALILNGDVITSINISRLAESHDSIAAVRLRTKYGVLELDGDSVSAFREKKEIDSMWMNAGVYHLTKKTMKAMPKKGNAETTLFPRLASQKRLGVTRFANVHWYSIDSHKDIEECSSNIRTITRAWKRVDTRVRT